MMAYPCKKGKEQCAGGEQKLSSARAFDVRRDEEQRNAAQHIAPAADHPAGKIGEDQVCRAIYEIAGARAAPQAIEQGRSGEKIQCDLRAIDDEGKAWIGLRHVEMLGEIF